MSNASQKAQLKKDKIMETVAWYAGYYRANPQRFAKDCLNLNLKWFQQILLWAMMHYNYFAFIAARSLGKTYLTAIFCVVRCILFPGSKIIVCSGTIPQANEVLLKIQDELMPKSAFLRNEIAKCNIPASQSAEIKFKCGSWIRTRPSTDNARSGRANLIVVDEFRMVDENIINTVIRRFLGTPRHPDYLNKPEYAHLMERNQEIYMSSAYFKSSWAWKKVQSYTLNFLDDKRKYFIVGLPYQLSIREGLLSREQIEDEMSETNFNELLFKMEMETFWFGDDGDSLFKFDDLKHCRKIEHALLPLKYYNANNPVPRVSDNGKRILSVDVALMQSTKKKKNDAASLFINELVQQDATTYQSNFCYGESFEGKTTDALGLIIMRYFYCYKCTDLVLDTQGLGIGVYDFIIKDQYDPETGKVYKALTCINDEDMAARCKVKEANKVVWSVKASAAFNNEICVLLRTGIMNGKINLLIDETESNDKIEKTIKKFKSLSDVEQALIKNPFVQTTLAIYELIKLEHEVKDGKIKVHEQSGMRKDRYSSMAYNFWCATQLELQLKPKAEDTQTLLNKFFNKPAKHSFNRGR